MRLAMIHLAMWIVSFVVVAGTALWIVTAILGGLIIWTNAREEARSRPKKRKKEMVDRIYVADPAEKRTGWGVHYPSGKRVWMEYVYDPKWARAPSRH